MTQRDWSWVEKELVALDGFYGTLHSQHRKEEDYYNLLYPVPRVNNIEIYRPATAMEIINTATDHVPLGNMQVEVPPRARTEKAKDQAELMRRFYTAVNYWVDLDPRQPKRLAVKHGFMYGCFFLKVVYNHDSYIPIANREDDMGYRRGVPPFILKAVNPINAYPDPGGRYFIERYQRKAGAVTEAWPEFKSDSDQRDVQWTEYWDEEHHAAWCAGQEIYNKAHNYGILPYVTGEAGYGNEGDGNKPEDRIKGLLYPVHSLLEMEATVLAEYEAIIRSYAWPTYFAYKSGLNDDALQNITSDLGIINWLDEGQQPPFLMQRPVPPTELLNLHGIIMDKIEQATFPRVVRGETPQGVSSGYKTVALAGMARIRFEAMMRAMTAALQRTNEIYARIAQNLIAPDKLTIWAKTNAESIDEKFDPEIVKGHYVNYVNLGAVAVEEEERRTMLGSRLLAQGQISEEDFMNRYLKHPNPREEIKNKRKERIINRIIDSGILDTRILEEMGATQEVKPTEPVGNPRQGITPSVTPRPVEAERMATQVRPGSIEEADLLARQIGRAGAPRPGESLPRR